MLSPRRFLTRACVLTALATMAPVLPAQDIRISLAAWTEPVLMDTLKQTHDVGAPASRVYEATLKAFGELGIPVGQPDARAGIIGNGRFETSRVFLGAPLSRSYDCGEGLTGPYADSFRLDIAVVAWVSPAAQGAKLAVATIASGRDISGVVRLPRPCVSTGAVEQKIFDRVDKLLNP